MKIVQYTLEPNSGIVTEIAMLSGAEILSVAEQQGKVCLWALCESDARVARRRFVLVEAGQEFDLRTTAGTRIHMVYGLSKKQYVGAVHLSGPEPLVLHLFDLGIW